MKNNMVVTSGIMVNMTKKEFLDLIDERDALRAKLVRLQEKHPNIPCYWECDEDGVWFTACKGAFCFESEGIKENGYIYCPKCGQKIVEVKKIYDNEDEY